MSESCTPTIGKTITDAKGETAMNPPQTEPSKVEVNLTCLCCGSNKSSVKHAFDFEASPGTFVLRSCGSCGLLFNSPRVLDLAALYESEYYVFSEPESVRYDHAFAQVRRHLDPQLGVAEGHLDILEVGSARGHLLHILNHIGHRACGIEISQHASQWSRRWFGVDVRQGMIEDYAKDPSAGRFDLVWCNDVIEHVPDPLAFVRSCAEVLKPGGRLILDTPNAGSSAVLASRPDWNGYNPFHIFLFNEANIGMLCRKARLESGVAFSYGNIQEDLRKPVGKSRRALISALRKLKLLGPIRRVKQRITYCDGNLKREPMSADEIVRQLESRKWYSNTEDATALLARGLHGNNLVFHAVKQVPTAES